jgi:group I intron endonuclease
MNVYCLYFPNGKRYFGVENKTGQRITTHKSSAGKRKLGERPQLVTKALRKYGWDQVQYRYIVSGVSKDVGLAIEAIMIRLHRTQDLRLGYNIDPGGGRYRCGVKASEETRMKLSRSQKLLNRKMPEEHKEKLRHMSRTRVRTPEERAKIAKTLTGRKRSAEAIRKHREKVTGRKLVGAELEMVRARLRERNARPVSEETRRKMSESAKKRRCSAETRRKISEGNKGKKHTEESRIKMSRSMKGKPKSPEHIEKLSQALKGRTVHNTGKKRIVDENGKTRYVEKNLLDLSVSPS